MFEVWDIPWQGTSTLLKQKCQPKGQSAVKAIIIKARMFVVQNMAKKPRNTFAYCENFR